MGLIWNNEYVLEKNKEPHKTGCSSAEEMEMADNCFQVWLCSVNEFFSLPLSFLLVLTMSLLPFIPLSYTHTHTGWLTPLCLCFFFLSDVHIYPLLGFTHDKAVTLFFFPPFLFHHIPFTTLSYMFFCPPHSSPQSIINLFVNFFLIFFFYG